MANDRDETVPAVAAVAISSTPTHDTDTPADGTKDTYGVGATIQVRLGYSEAVTVDTSRGRPRLKIKMHEDFGEKWAVYESGSGTQLPLFTYTVVSGNTSSNGSSDAGIRVLANSLELTGGSIRSAASGRDASLAHAVGGPWSDHRVDGALDGQGPEFKIATVRDKSLVIVFDENLDDTSLPAGSSVCVTATSPGGSARHICGSTAAFDTIHPSNLNVSLGQAVKSDEAVTVSYTQPNQNFLKDGTGNAVASFSDEAVTNNTIGIAPVTIDSVSQGTESGSLSVNWTAPTTGGVQPTDYDLRYYAGSEGPPAGREADWIEEAPGLPDPGTDTSATIKGLAANTAYRVQLRGKTSAEIGPWSASVGQTTAAAPATNNAPRVLATKPVDAQGNICRALADPLSNNTKDDANTNTTIVFSPLATRGAETTEWPSACSGSDISAVPLFDDRDGDTLTITAELRDLPANVRVAPLVPFIQQPTNSNSGYVAFRGTAAFKRTTAWVYLTATDPHGASVTTKHGFNVGPHSPEIGAPSLAETKDQEASTSREFSLVLPAATGGDLGSGDGQVFPYFYRLTGLPKGLVFDEVTRTISGTPLETGTFTVTYTADDSDEKGSAYLNPLTTDTSDVASDQFTITVAETPHIDLVRVVSAPTHDANGDGKNDTYGKGDKIVVDVEYSEPVKVDIPVGSGNGVRLRLDVGRNDDDQTNSRKAIDLTGVHHGGKTLRFEYTVLTADNDPDGVWVQTHPDTGQLLFVRGTASITRLGTTVDAEVNKSGLATGAALDGDGIPMTYVNGRLTAGGPRPTDANVDGTRLLVVFDEDLAALSAADLEALQLHFGVQGVDGTGGNRNAWQHPSKVESHVNLNYLVLTLGVAARKNDVVTLSYKRFDHKGPLKDADGNMAPAFVDFEVTNNTGGFAAPTPQEATVSGKTLEIVFNGDLKASTTVPGSAFTVEASDPDYDSRPIAGTGTATVSGTKVTVTLDEAVEPGELANVSYDQPKAGTPRLQSDSITPSPVQSFNGFRIETVKDATAPGLVAGAAVQTRAVPAQTEVALYFDEALHTNYVPENGAFSVTVGTETAVNPASVAIEGSAVTLTVNKAAAEGATVQVVYTKGTNPIQDLAGNEAAAFDTDDLNETTEPHKLAEPLVASAAGTPTVVVTRPGSEVGKLVGNTGQVLAGQITFDNDIAQAFTTGSHADGYKLTSVAVPFHLSSPPANSHAISIHASNSSNRPGASVGTLAQDSLSSFTGTYTASGAGIDLDPGTTYFVVLDTVSPSSGLSVEVTNSDAEDSGAADGWSLGDTLLWKPTANTAWQSTGNLWQIALHGKARSILDLKVSGSRVTLTYDKFLDPASVPGPERFTLLQDAGLGESVEYGRVAGVTVEGKEAVLHLGSPVYPCAGQYPFTLTYASSETGRNLRTMTGHLAPDIDAEAVTNRRWSGCDVAGVSGNSGGGTGQGSQGKSLSLKFDRPLDTGKALKASLFGLAGASGGSAPAVAGAAYSADGAGVVLTLERALGSGETVTVGYSRPRGEPGLWDAEGRQLADFSGVEYTAPETATVTAVEIVSDAGGDDTYALGQEIQVRITFDEAVEVEGSPRLKIDMDRGDWGEKWAAYASGSGTEELTFAYEVVEPNTSTEGVAVVADTLEANGGAIRSAAAGTDAYLSHDGLDHDPDHKVDWQLEPSAPSAPTTTGVAISSQPTNGDTYGLGETIRVTMSFSDAVDVTEAPRLKIDMDAGDWGEKWAGYESGGGTDSLTFAYTVVEPNESTQGIAVLADTLEANGGTIRSAETEADADLSHDGLDHDPDHKVDWQVQPAAPSPPTTTGVAISSQRASSDTYGLGETIRVTVSFSEAVDVTGSPQLTIDMDPADWGEKRAAYEGGSGTASLTFAYTVVEPNDSTQGIAVLANTLDANGGAIRSTATETDAELSHDGLDHDPNHKVDWDLGSHASVPTATGVAVSSRPAVGDTYARGETIRVTVSFSEPVDVTGSPQLEIDMDPADWGEKWAAYESGGGSNSLTFAYEVVEPNISTVGIAILANTLELNSGAIQSAATAADAELSHDGLDHDPAHKVDWRPTPVTVGVAVSSQPAADDTYRLGETIRVRLTFSEAVDVAGSPRLMVDLDPADWGEKWAMYEGGGGNDSLTFVHEVVEPNLSIQGIAVLASTLEAGSGAIQSTATGADADLSHDGLDHDPAHKVDWRPEAVTVTGVSVVSDAGGDDTYRLGDTIAIQVSFSDAVAVDGTPQLKIDMDPADWGEKWATYASGGGSDTLMFTHEVVEPNFSTQGIAVLADTLEAGGGAIRSAATEADADLSHDGLDHDPAHKVDWRPALTVADARIKEGAGAAVEFEVRLGRAASQTVTVDYATADGSARAGEDYTAASGTLRFEPGESSKTIAVGVLDDAHDEGEETFTLVLSNASGAWLEDAEATGTIENTDLMPAALLARFGRATAEQVVTHIEERMAAPRQQGFRARFAGRDLQPGSERDFALGFLQQFAQPGMGPAGAAPMGGPGMGGMAPVGGAAMGAGSMGTGSHSAGVGMSGLGMRDGMGMGGGMGMGAGMSGAMGMGGAGGMPGAIGMAGQQPMGYGSPGAADERGLFSTMLGYDPLANSEFELNRESRGGILSVWSRSSRSNFSGMEDALSLNGDVRTTMIGADYSRGALTLGLSVGRTLGLGGYSGPSGGQMTTSMTGFYPWVGYQVNDRVSVWGTTGYGTGALSLTPDGQSALDTGVSMMMSAVGTRGELVGSRATGGFALAFKADALWVGAASDLLEGPTGRLNASAAGVTRVRTALEGSRGFTLGGRLSLTPSVEVGLRRDGGDAETGAGMDIGGGVAFSDTVTGLSLDVRVRTLVVHQADGFRERGMSLSFGWNPTPSSPLGLTARVAPSWGGQATGGAEALWGNQMAYGMGSHQMRNASGQVSAEVGYGLPVGIRFVGTPKVGISNSTYGRDYRFGYGLGLLEQGTVSFEVGAEAQRRENPTAGEVSNAFMGRATLGW